MNASMTKIKHRKRPKPAPTLPKHLFPDLEIEGKPFKARPALDEQAVRQEVLNVLTAELLQERGLIAAPEQIIRRTLSSRRMPDVLVDFQGLRLAIEGEFDSPRAEDKSSRAALARVEDGIAHIGLGLVYPESLRTLGGDIQQLRAALEVATLRYALVTETEATQHKLPFPFAEGKMEQVFMFARGDMNTLADDLRRSYESLVKEEVLERAVDLLQKGIEGFLGSLIRQPATAARFASALGIKELPKSKHSSGSKSEE